MSYKFAVALLPIASFVQAQTSAVSLGEMTISTASRFEEPVSTVLAPVSVLTREQMEDLGANSLVDALKILPGIEIGQNGGRGQLASIFLRGTNSSHVLVLVDGVRLPRSMLGTVDFNMFSLDSVERIEVIRGSGATVYGSDAIGGVINIITRSNTLRRSISIGTGSMDTDSVSIGFTQPITETLTLQAMGGYEKTDGYNVRPDVAPANDTHGFSGKNMSIRFGYSPSEQLEANLVGRWYENEVGYAAFDGAKRFLWVESQSIGGDIQYQQGGWQHLLRFEYSKQSDYDFAATEAKNDDNLKSEISYLYSTLASKAQIRENLSVTLGGDISQEKYLSGSFITASDIVDNPRENIGLFAMTNWQLTPSWQLEASTRFDKNQQYGSNHTEQVSLGWDITENYRAFTSYGNAFKAPTFDKLYGFGGNTDLKPEQATNIELGIEGFTDNMQWSINGYINDIDNLIMSEKIGGIWVNKNVDKAKIRGIELAAGFDLGIASNLFSVELRDPVDETNNQQLARRAKKLAKWQGALPIGDFLFGAHYSYQSERPDFTGGEILPSYDVWDFTAEYSVSDYMKVRAKLANAFDEYYESAGNYPAPERAFYLDVDFNF